ncbi:MAG: hypothetical protein K2Q26_08140 [Bdellovibrionales bacterium]|nr:hypothetical protein [Bdellovibrionales bacterium]
MSEPSFNFLGIDQTGAVNSKGKPKPLPACLISGDVVSVFYINSFSKELIKSYKPDLICLDCVLGLPLSTSVGLREALTRADRVEKFGRSEAQRFFAELAQGRKHTRGVEVALGANSVFTVYPFQKNIQTGTFRFWKEMAADPHWFYFPALPREKKYAGRRIPIVEGYPSYYWNVLFKEKNRNPLKILDRLRLFYPQLRISRKDKEILLKDVNLADAILLALAAYEFRHETHRTSHTEGWILGYHSKI